MSTTDAPTTLVRMMGEREKRLSALEARLATLRTAPSVLDLEVRRMEREGRKRLEDFAALMQRNPQEARTILEALVTVPLRFAPVETPDGKRYEITGEIGLETMFAPEDKTPVEYRRRPQRDTLCTARRKAAGKAPIGLLRCPRPSWRQRNSKYT
jgi:hypothetical protein